MEKFREFSQKFCLKEISIIFVFSLILFVIFCGKTESFLIDAGREAYIPWRMLDGSLLYKDIFNVYGPVSYQINAVLFAIFSPHLNTLYAAGYVTSLLILYLIFFITKMFTDRTTSLYTALIVMVSCVFTKTLFSFIFPYSYGAIYGLAGFLLSVLFYIIFLRDCSSKYLYWAFAFAGFAFANKIEYLPYALVLFLSLIFIKPALKQFLFSVLSFFAVPMISFGILLLQGVGFGDFVNAGKLIINLVHTPAVEFYYKNYGMYFGGSWVLFSLKILWKLLLFGTPLAVLYSILASDRFGKKVPQYILPIIAFAAAFLNFGRIKTFEYSFFSWLGLVCIVILVWQAWLIFKKKADYKYLFLLIAALCASVKGISSISTECYGTFSIAVLMIPFMIFVSGLSVKYKDLWLKIFHYITLTVIFVYVLAISAHALYNKIYPVKTQRGNIYVKAYMPHIGEMVDFINKNTDKNSVIVSVPEGAMVNFLTGRKSNDKYYYLIPVNEQLFGSEKIAKDFAKNPPDYFLLNTMPYDCYGKNDFCSYAEPVCKFIAENYVLNSYTKDPVRFYLYKRK